ncbi:MAG: hypothetical protein ISR58_08830 [Anaerolineales bacterium]|nr:hypothetical protein [Chloroflexota bacterium]MBL6981282.1 hypothetical protein [Anaerolineales bacterium]
MHPNTKSTVLIVAIIMLIISMSCVAVTKALDFSSTGEVPTQPAVNTSTPVADAASDAIAGSTNEEAEESEESIPPQDCDDCDYWDDFEFDENDRPILSGDELNQDTEHFKIHYTLEGRDAVLSTDYVDEMAAALEFSWEIEIAQFGWAPPPPDDGIGGDDRYDVYIQNVFEDGTAGYTEGGDERYRGPQQGVIGDNPLTEAVETRASVSYIVMDNDYAELDEWAAEDGEVNTIDPLELMRSTVAHEFNHAIQFGYDGEEPADWLWEATASWMQDEVYDDINDAEEDLLAVFKSPDTCQLAYGGEERVEDENHWYGEWIFLRYISEHHGHETVRSIWEHARDLDGYAALEAALGDAGTTLDDTFRGFSLTLLTRAFEEGAGYPILRLEGEASMESGFVPNDGVGQMAADYVEIQANGVVTVALKSDHLEGMLVGIQGNQGSVFTMAGNQGSVFTMAGNQASVDSSHFDHLYLIVLNLEKADREYDCEFAPYTVEITSGDQPQAASESLQASNFQTPEPEPLLDPEEYWGEGWDEGAYEEVDPPAELIPSYLPEGYEFIEAYLMEAEDYEYEYDAELIWYIPGEETATIIDFYGPGVDDFIDITASDSPYDTLDEWLDAAEYDPYADELASINDVDLLLEDWTDELGAYSIATFIHAGQFIVIEGTISADEMTKVIESLPVLP